jgi:hypothetical protein
LLCELSLGGWRCDRLLLLELVLEVSLLLEELVELEASLDRERCLPPSVSDWSAVSADWRALEGVLRPCAVR